MKASERYRAAAKKERAAIIELMRKDIEWASPNVAERIEALIILIEARVI